MNTAMVKRSAIALIALFMACGALFGVHYAQALTSYSDLDAGDLIRGETFTAVYYLGADGLRYVFPNDKTYFTCIRISMMLDGSQIQTLLASRSVEMSPTNQELK